MVDAHLGRPTGQGRDALLLGVSMLAVAALVLLVGSDADRLGLNLPVSNRENDYLLGVSWAFLIGLFLWLLPIDRRFKADLMALWVLRCGVTLGVMLFYEARYSGLDAYSYFQYGRDYSPNWIALVGVSSTERLLAFTSALSWVVPESFHALKVTFSFIGLIGTYFACRAAIMAVDSRASSRLVFYVVGAFPSLVFWSSTIGKDPIAMLGLGAYAYGVVGWCRYHRMPSAFWGLVGLLICVTIRPWLGPILVGPLVLLPSRSQKPSSLGARLLTVALTWGACLAVLQAMGAHSAGGITELIASHAEGWQRGGGGSTQMVTTNFRDVTSLITFVPVGMLTALFRPLPGEVEHAFGLLAGVESLALLALLGRAVIRTRLASLGRGVAPWLLAVVVAWAAVYSLISAFNLGAAVRFRIQVLPFLLPLLVLIGASPEARKRALALKLRQAAVNEPTNPAPEEMEPSLHLSPGAAGA